MRPRSEADFTCPTDDAPELMVVARDFLYGMKIAKKPAATCAFPPVELEGADEAMPLPTTEDENTLIRLARHLLFACGNVREEALKHVLLFITGAFGRHCRDKSCSRGEACTLRAVADFDPTKALEYAEAVLELPTPIALLAKCVIEMRTHAIAGGRLSAFEHVTEKHAALLASLVYPATYPQSIKAKCFDLLGNYIAEDGKFFATTPADIATILQTFDGQTKTYFPSSLEDCTEMLKADLANGTRRDYVLSEFKRKHTRAGKGAEDAAPAAPAPPHDVDPEAQDEAPSDKRKKRPRPVGMRRRWCRTGKTRRRSSR